MFSPLQPESVSPCLPGPSVGAALRSDSEPRSQAGSAAAAGEGAALLCRAQVYQDRPARSCQDALSARMRAFLRMCDERTARPAGLATLDVPGETTVHELAQMVAEGGQSALPVGALGLLNLNKALFMPRVCPRKASDVKIKVRRGSPSRVANVAGRRAGVFHPRGGLRSPTCGYSRRIESSPCTLPPASATACRPAAS